MYDPAAVIKVVSSKAYIAARLSPYRVDRVFQKYGTFLEGTILKNLCLNGDTAYVLESSSPYFWYKVRPNGVQTETHCLDRPEEFRATPAYATAICTGWEQIGKY